VLVALGAMVVAMPLAGAGAAEPTWATYKGRLIDVSRNWEGAHACAVLSPGDVRCFDNQAELERTLAKSAPVTSSLGSMSVDTIDAYCLNRSDLYLILYQDTSFGGNSLSFRDADTWFNLSDYSFDNITSSWKNNTYCDATAAADASGGGSTTTLGARSQATSMATGWDNVISSVEIVS
jgi:hypothetical protein